MNERDTLDHLFRHQAGQMVATLTRIFGIEHVELAEDVVQDAMVQALRQWPYRSPPANPRAWLIQVAKNRALDVMRRKRRWRDKEFAIHRAFSTETAETETRLGRELRDDTLMLVFACCHPELAPAAQIALTLKTVGGFSVDEIARAFLARAETIAQRLVRAKRTLRAVAELSIPGPDALEARLQPALRVLYLMFNEGYAAGSGEDLIRTDLCAEALRLAGLLAEHPETGRPETHALAALLHLQAARQPARTDAVGDLVRLPDQDRSLWDRRLVAAGMRHLGQSARGSVETAYHVEAEIAACHALASSDAETDWPRILAAYDRLYAESPTIVVAANRAVALWKVRDAAQALTWLDSVLDETTRPTYAPALAVRGELLVAIGRSEEAAAVFRQAAEASQAEPTRRFLQGRAAACLR